MLSSDMHGLAPKPRPDGPDRGAQAETIYREISGARADRPQLARLMAKLMPGDVVVVTKLDRLGRSTRELLELIERLARRPAVGYLQFARPAAVNGSSRHSRLLSAT
jgi:DNA invertase Pin-like site-specific DNA recombinase